MAKYISERTMRRIQIINADTAHLLGRRRWIQLACDLAIGYYYYSAMRTAGENAEELLNWRKSKKSFRYSTNVWVLMLHCLSCMMCTFMEQTTASYITNYTRTL